MCLSIIGSGFIGSYVSKILNNQQVSHFIYNTQHFNLCDESTWINLSSDTTQLLITAGSMSNDLSVLKSVNEQPIEKLCSYFKVIGVNKIIFLSSGAVYGDYPDDTHPGIECNPSSYYGLSKFNAERSFLKNWNGLLNIVRLYFTYGPLQNRPRLIPNLVDKIQKKQPILINKEGGPKITLNHVKDVANHLIETFINHDHKIIIENLASHFTIKIEDLANTLAAYLGEEPRFEIKNSFEPNHTSIPFPKVWEKSGYLGDVFHEIQ